MSIAPHAEERSATRERSGFLLRRVKIRNYKSIKSCDVELGPFTILVGRNGSGKSNFLGALRLICAGLRAAEDWGFGTLGPWSGIADSYYDLPTAGIAIEASFDGSEISYAVQLDVRALTGLAVSYERLIVVDVNGVASSYECRRGRVVDSTVSFLPPGTEDCLYLRRAASIPEFRPAFDSFSNMGFYDIDTDIMRRTQGDHSGVILARDGSNFASVWNYIEHVAHGGTSVIVERLRKVVPQFHAVRYQDFGPYKTLAFERHEPVDGEPRSFYAAGVSDGTLRALGILVAINQLANDGRPIRLVGIEEPEAALHPAAAGALMDALREAATHTQVLVTTHGADLLDRFDPEEDHLLAVEFRDGRTEIGPVNPASRAAIREHLYSAGELLRMDQLHPDRLDVERQAAADDPGTPGGRP